MDESNIEIRGQPVDIRTQARDIAIEGMTCDHCVRTVESALRKVKGVREVQVNQKEARARVTFDTTLTNIPALHDVLLKSGYKPVAAADEP